MAMRIRKKTLIIFTLSLVVLIYTQCIYRDRPEPDPRGELYAGAAACRDCHSSIVASYMQTAHYHSSAVADPARLAAFIRPENSTVNYGPERQLKVSARDGGVYQDYFENGKYTIGEKTDIVFGAGSKALTFGYWKDQQVFQLPLTYLKEQQIWTNSPGFPIDHAYFTRPVTSRCFECHTTYVSRFQEQTGTLELTEKYRPETVRYGIDCERCHGPAALHVNFHREHPDAAQAKFITRVGTLHRQQQLDLCGTCHSGDAAGLKSIFRFQPGDSLAAYYLHFPGASPDVHGMQMQLLEQSACYQRSELTCGSCHSPHQSETGKIQVFISKCMNCHQQSRHAVKELKQQGNCITCHMPLQASKSLDFNNSQKSNSIAYKLRTHRIAVYPHLNSD
ncbi:hypothetical protein GCM10027051_15510 [Niabella terrae]